MSEGEYIRVAMQEIAAINGTHLFESLHSVPLSGLVFQILITVLWTLEAISTTIEKAPQDAVDKLRGKRPTLTYVVVGKRHHIRFFPINKDQADKSGNCLPGLILDTGELMSPRFYDFYLLSHPGLIGSEFFLSIESGKLLLKRKKNVSLFICSLETGSLCCSQRRESLRCEYVSDLSCP